MRRVRRDVRVTRVYGWRCANDGCPALHSTKEKAKACRYLTGKARERLEARARIVARRSERVKKNERTRAAFRMVVENGESLCATARVLGLSPSQVSQLVIDHFRDFIKMWTNAKCVYRSYSLSDLRAMWRFDSTGEIT